MENKNNLRITSFDIAKCPDKELRIIVGISPKIKSKNKFIQKIFVKLFGYKIDYKNITAKELKINPKDFPLGFNSDITININ